MNVFLIYPFYLNKALTKVHLGILKIILKSSKKLLLLDKNFMTVLGDVVNILKNIPGIFLGCLLRTRRKISSKNWYFLLIPNFLEFDSEATIDNNLCLTPIVLGCTDNSFTEYNPDVPANFDDGSCITPIILGCTDNNYLEYWSYDTLTFSLSNLDPVANTDDGSCTYIILEGCTDENFVQYNALANVDNNSCENLIVLGCTDVLAFNYDPYANTDNGLC